MQRRSLTRRHALGLGAAAVAATALRPSPSLALVRRPTAFAQDLTDALGEGARASAWHTLPVVRAPLRFDLLGLRWPAGARVRAEVRARRRGGRWTPWTALASAGDHAPDGARPVPGTEPCWTGTADEYQVRLQGSPRRLEARFVRARPVAGAARRLAGRAAKAPAGAAQVPVIVPRSAWGGDAFPPKEDVLYGTVQAGFVHHTVTANAYGPEDSAAMVLGICRYHRDHNGWNDIGYNFLVDRFGQVFEGRAGGVESAVVGAQAQGYNSMSTGVACLGDFSAGAAPDPAVEAIARLLAWKLTLHGTPVTGELTVTSTGGASNRYPAGTPVTLQRISGHRDGDLTECPGAGLYAQLEAIRARAAGLAVPVSSLTVAVQASTVRAPEPLVLSGVLRFADGADASLRTLQLEFQSAPGQAWTVVGAITTGADGAWAATVPATGSGRVRATFAGDGVHGAISTTPVRVRVMPALTVQIDRPTVRTGRRIPFSGTVEPFAPKRVLVTLERHTSRGVVRVQTKRVRVRGGRFSTYVRPRLRGRYRLTVQAAGTTVRRKLRAT